MRYLSLTWLVLMAAVAVAAPKVRPLYDERFFEPVAEVVSPHVPWARPYVTPPKVLFITHRQAMREVIELAQRLEMDYQVFAMEKPGAFDETGVGVDSSWKAIRGNSAEELAESLRAKLARPHDVIVIGGIDWDKLPLDCRYEILKQVKSGTGLVGCVRAKDPYLQELLAQADFGWNWATWSGAAQGVADYFGTGVFEGSVDYSGGHTGQAALRVACQSVTKGSRESARAGYHPGQIKLEPNTEYIFSMWTKTQGLKDGQATVSLHPQPRGVPVAASDDWKLTEHRFKTNDAVLTTGMYLLTYQPGVVWYDDVKLVKAGTEENLLPNPSFEYPGPAPVELAEGFAHQTLPAFSKYPDQKSFLRGVFQTANFREGRIGFVSYGVPTVQMMTPGPDRPVQYCRDDYDSYLQLAARLILWGAKKTPPVSVVTTAVEGKAGEALTAPVVVRCEKAVGKAAVTAKASYPGPAGHPFLKEGVTAAADLKAGENTVSLTLPALPAGLHRVNVQVLAGGKVVGFATVAANAVAPVTIKAVELAQPSTSLGEPLKGTVTVEGPVAGAQLRLAARDNNGRLIGAANVPVTGADTAFSLPVLPSSTIIGWLQADLVQGDKTLASERRDFSINNLYAPRDDVQLVMWQGYGNTFLHPVLAESFSANGVDAFYDGGAIGYGPYANQWWLPYATRFTDKKTDWYQLKPTREAGDLVRDPCLTNPEYRATVKETLSKAAVRGLQYSTSDFTLGDENMLVSGKWDLCMSDTCVEDFRRWTRESYGSLEKLNASWGSNFTNWAEVKPQTLEEAKKTGNLVPWVDHRLHMETVWAGIHGWSREVIKETVPHARVGYEGSDSHVSSWLAADYWQLANAMSLNNIYYRDFLSLAVRDFSTPDTLLGAGWFGGYAGNRNEQFMRWFPWRTLFKGSNSFWVWCGWGNAGSVMAFDGSLYPFFTSACEEIAEIKDGPGKLLVNAQRMHDGIAILWSNSSVHLAEATPQFPAMDGALNSTVAVLHDCGLEAKVLSYEQVKQGKLNDGSFKVLLLVGAQALSAAEVEEIRKFAQGGGTVIADLRPGVADEHGKPYAQAGLDEVFGVKQGPAFQRVIGPADFVSVKLESAVADGAVAVASGKAAGKVGETPAMIANTCGKGKGVLLNMSLEGYLKVPKVEGEDFAGWNEGAAYRALLNGILKVAGLEPAVTVTPEAPRVEVSRFQRGGVMYVGVVQSLPRETIDYTNRLAPVPQARPVTIDFGTRTHVYDTRARTYLGQSQTIKTTLTPGVAQMYALLPYKLEGVRVQAPAQVKAGQPLVYDVRLGVRGQPETHVVHVEIFGPDGKERPWYAGNLMSDQSPVATTGLARGTVALALDDQPGTWKIVARDAATGVTGTATFKVTQ